MHQCRSLGSVRWAHLRPPQSRSVLFFRRSDGRAGEKREKKPADRHLTKRVGENARHNAGNCLLFVCGVQVGHRLAHFLMRAFPHLACPSPCALAKALDVEHRAHSRTDCSILHCFAPPALRRTHPLVCIPGAPACNLATLMWGTAEWLTTVRRNAGSCPRL